MKVGWIGLGEIGVEMALRVIGAGQDLTAYDRGTGKQRVADAGGRILADYPAIAREADVVCLCLFSDAQVREVMFDNGILAAMAPGSVLAIHTTGSAVLARELAEKAPGGVAVLDACFSGSAQDTANGDLTLMVGGEGTALETARPVLSTYASRINHVGPTGAGQTIKLLNNLLFATNLKQAAEIAAMAEAQGLDPKLAAQVICQSSGSSMAMSLLQSASAAQILDSARHYMVKDVKAAADAAHDAGLDISNFTPTIEFFR